MKVNESSPDTSSQVEPEEDSSNSEEFRPLVVKKNRFWHAQLNKRNGLIALVVLGVLLYYLFGGKNENSSMKLATWNIAAINNNPFEYYTHYENENYKALMKNMEDFIENTGDRDINVSEVFTKDMWLGLKKRFEESGWAELDLVEKYYETDYKNRKIVSGYLRDDELGLKRLASYPDRYSNTIQQPDGQSLFRPTVINLYGGEVAPLEKWYENWIGFIFDIDVVSKNKQGETTTTKVYQRFRPIEQKKYPKITKEEERISLPLQTLCLAIFDSILIHILNTIAADSWMPIKLELGSKLNKGKLDRTMQILEQSYSDRDAIFLQEAGSAFTGYFEKSSLAKDFKMFVPAKMNKRDQNSMIILRNSAFSSCKEVTAEILALIPEDTKLGVGDGDFFAVQCLDSNGFSYVLGSFHGDTNGLQTIPMVSTVHNAMQKKFTDDRLIFGLDANVYIEGSEKKQGHREFVNFFNGGKMNSIWGNDPDPQKCLTCFNARTYLQPQLNKACKSAVFLEKKCGDINPKDFILFYSKDFEPINVAKDNTGKKNYIEDTPFPSLEFPSDHGILSGEIKIIG